MFVIPAISHRCAQQVCLFDELDPAKLITITITYHKHFTPLATDSKL